MRMPRPLFPRASRRGGKTTMPNRAGTDAAHAIAAGIEAGRKDTDAKLAGQDRDDAAGDAALGWHADLVNPAAREIIHAASFHDTEHTLDVLAAERLFAGERMGAVIGEGGRHHGEVAAGHG